MKLVIENLNKTYANGVRALKNINLTIYEGMFGLLGPNGAGKSTLMRTIAALQEADSGSITLDEIDVLRQKDEVRKILGYLPQEFGLYPKISAETLLDHLAYLKGIKDKRQRRNVVSALLQKTNLWSARNHNLGGFSGGMKQRFGIAQALLADPRLIIVDEPTAGLDPAERNRFLNLLSEIGENTIVILSTHIVDDVKELCSQMSIINNGEVLYKGRPSEALARLEGKVWRKRIDKTELAHHKQLFNVVSERLLGGKPEIHVVSETQPDESFERMPAGLEDVYFSYIRATETAEDELTNH
ncbi:MAG TPA: ABC transporter ATP-binding protein [Chryseosolibacter sp.]